MHKNCKVTYVIVDLQRRGFMYYYGGCNSCYPNQTYYYPTHNSNYAVVLVLFILLVIVIGTRWSN